MKIGKILAVALVVVASLFLMSTSVVLGQTCLSGYCPCRGNFDCDKDVDGSDAAVFKKFYGVSPFNAVCRPHCQAPVPKTGQTTSYATGDDGDLEKGVIWEDPRFYDNGDGTITDGLTGLIWLKNANCFGTRTWNNALSDSNGLENGECGLTDDSQPGDWRLPNRKELFSLIHDNYYGPAVPDTVGTGKWSQGDPFNNVQPEVYWSSTTDPVSSMIAWFLNMYNGYVRNEFKGNYYYVWPVRGGH